MNREHRKPVIMIVDDQPQNLNMLISFLEEFGFRVAFAQSGEEALKRAEYALPDLILLDLMRRES